jgi:FtsH-binding integral membrane protein
MSLGLNRLLPISSCAHYSPSGEVFVHLNDAYNASIINCVVVAPGVLQFFIEKNKNTFMGSLLYILAVILIIGWIVGFFAFHAGGIIHALLVIAVIVIIVRVIQGRGV